MVKKLTFFLIYSVWSIALEIRGTSRLAEGSRTEGLIGIPEFTYLVQQDSETFWISFLVGQGVEVPGSALSYHLNSNLYCFMVYKVRSRALFTFLYPYFIWVLISLFKKISFYLLLQKKEDHAKYDLAYWMLYIYINLHPCIKRHGLNSY